MNKYIKMVKKYISTQGQRPVTQILTWTIVRVNSILAAKDQKRCRNAFGNKKQPVRADARLARAAESAGNSPGYRLVHICRGEHDEWGISTQLHSRFFYRICTLPQEDLQKTLLGSKQQRREDSQHPCYQKKWYIPW